MNKSINNRKFQVPDQNRHLRQDNNIDNDINNKRNINKTTVGRSSNTTRHQDSGDPSEHLHRFREILLTMRAIKRVFQACRKTKDFCYKAKAEVFEVTLEVNNAFNPSRWMHTACNMNNMEEEETLTGVAKGSILAYFFNVPYDELLILDLPSEATAKLAQRTQQHQSRNCSSNETGTEMDIRKRSDRNLEERRSDFSSKNNLRSHITVGVGNRDRGD